MTKVKNKQVGAITVTREDGSFYVVPVLEPGGALRFAVGAPDAHGQVWRLWSMRTATDFYLSTRSKVPDDSKWSFHASGDWRLQYDRPRAEELGVSRVLTQWERPAPGPSGMVEVTRIITPTDDIVANGHQAKDAEKIEWVPPAQAGRATVFHVLVLPPDSPFKAPANADLVGALLLPDRTLVVVVVSASDIPRDLLDAFQMARDEVTKNPPPGTPKNYVPRSDPEYRCISDAYTPDDQHFIWDLLM